jgi:hypothetical protein
MTRTGQKTAFAFAGGGSLGAIQVGMLRVLVSEGVQPDFVVGASVGAMNAAYFAGAPNAEGVEGLAEIWSGLRRKEVFPVTFKSAFGLLSHPESVIDSGGLRHLIENNLAYACLEDATIPVHVTATDVDGMAVVLSKGPAIDAILASTAIPGIFPLVRIDGQTLMDGAIARNSYPGGGGPRSGTDYRASNRICLLLERASERSDRQGLARNHFVDRVAPHSRCRASRGRDRCVHRAGALSAQRVAIRFLGGASPHATRRGEHAKMARWRRTFAALPASGT